VVGPARPSVGVAVHRIAYEYVRIRVASPPPPPTVSFLRARSPLLALKSVEARRGVRSRTDRRRQPRAGRDVRPVGVRGGVGASARDDADAPNPRRPAARHPPHTHRTLATPTLLPLFRARGGPPPVPIPRAYHQGTGRRTARTLLACPVARWGGERPARVDLEGIGRGGVGLELVFSGGVEMGRGVWERCKRCRLAIGGFGAAARELRPEYRSSFRVVSCSPPAWPRGIGVAAQSTDRTRSY
jgi:hypothetical protein